MDLTNVPTATLAELADGTSAINGIGAVRSKPLQIALANVSGVLYVSRALGKTWEPNGMIAGGAKLPAIAVGGLAPTEPEPEPDPEVPSGGGVTGVTILASGDWFGNTGGTYTATQASSDGEGTGATFTVTVASGGGVTAVVSIDTAGSDYTVGEVITLDVTATGGIPDGDATLTVTAIG
jgi:VCBS repeat-containing protein